MNHRTGPTPPRLTGGQLRQQIAAEQSGQKPDCFLCGEPVLDQTFKPSFANGADENDRMLINSPCGHAMTYGVDLVMQVEAQMRMEAATRATEPDASSWPGVLDAVASALEGHGVWIPAHARQAIAEAVVAAVEKRLEVGEEQAWCKACRRVWEGRAHQCDAGSGAHRTELEDQRKARATAAGTADRFRDVLCESLGFPDDNPGDDVLVARLREHFGKTGPEPTAWRDRLAGYEAVRDQINEASADRGDSQ